MNYILPNFYNCYTMLKPLIKNIASTKNIKGVYGAFPFMIWQGGYNNNQFDNIALYPDVVGSTESYGALKEIIIDCGNEVLETKDLDDCFSNIVLDELIKNKKCYFAVTNKELINYLVEKYPDIKLVIHSAYLNKHSIDDLIILIKNYPAIKKVIIPYHYLAYNKEDISILKNLNLELLGEISLTTCGDCINCNFCLHKDHQAILNYSGESIFMSCEDRHLIADDKYYTTQKDLFISCDIDTLIFEPITLNHNSESIALIQTLMESNIL